MAPKEMTILQCHQEIGKLKGIISTHDSAMLRLREQASQFNSERDKARMEILALRQSLEVATQLKHEQDSLIYALKGSILTLEDTAARQAKTIKVQSNTISTSMSHEPRTTPLRSGSHHNTNAGEVRPHIYAQPPPSYNLHQGQQTANWNAPHHQTSGPSFATGFQPSASAGPVALNQQYNRNNSSLMVVQEEEIPDVDWSTEYTQLFKVVEDWARNFANVPDRARDMAIPEELKKQFGTVTDMSIVPELLGSGSTRFHLIARVINLHFTDVILRIGVLKGFNPEIDSKIGHARRNIQRGMPDNMRQAFMVIIADAVQELTKLPGFENWLERQISERASISWDVLNSLLAPGADMAWDDFRYMFAEAYRVCIAMASRPLTYTFDYPKYGRKSYFNPNCMVNRDPILKGDPLSLKKLDLKVRLSANPVVVVTDIITTAIVPKTVHMADVLLMK